MSADQAPSDQPLYRTPLYDLHVELGARMVPFAGYEMPVQYPLGVLGEHNHTREAAGLFDVSHMGQAWLLSADPAAEIEALVPGDIAALGEGRIRYTQFLNDAGGILDDLMISRMPDRDGRKALFIVVNAACKDADFAHMEANLSGAELRRLEDRALIALQGPKAAAVLEHHLACVSDMPFMSVRELDLGGTGVIVSRCGYTGEDGYEISIPDDKAADFARALLADDEVEAIGLGARDSLRLEAGLCLYGHDIDETTTPVEGDLVWSISKRRREQGGFPGADVVQRQIAEGAPRKRVGILPEGRAPAREGTEITDPDGRVIGAVTSGGFGPTFGGPVAMGYVEAAFAQPETPVSLLVRGKPRPAKVAKMPFVPQRYYRGK